MIVKLADDQPAQIGGVLPHPVEPGETVEVDDDVGKGLLAQSDKWLPVKKTTTKKGAD